jgi:tetratricopeptide (TPR) repeat protein
VEIQPEFALAHGELGRLFLAAGEMPKARLHIHRAVELAPHDLDLRIALGFLLNADHRQDKAMEIVEPLLKSRYDSVPLAVLYAQMAASLSRQADALANLHRNIASGNPKTARQESSLHFFAANLLDNLERYDEAFAEAALGNSLRGVQYDPGSVTRPVNEWIDYFTPATLARLPRATHGSRLPVFIVGMARSGTTLLEQILASHPDMHGAGELNWIFHLCELVARRHPPRGGKLSDSIDAMSLRDAEELAAEYLRPLKQLNPSATRVINKMHTNFIQLGLIQILFPGARVIHCRRDPMDTCLSCFMTDFAAGNDFSFSLPSLGHFHRNYVRMMAHWKNVLSLPMLEVVYEDVVNDLEGQTRRMLEFLDLPWDEQCLKFHENRRFVATASQQQVCRPIFHSSVGRWRNYEKHLGPLREALAE